MRYPCSKNESKSISYKFDFDNLGMKTLRLVLGFLTKHVKMATKRSCLGKFILLILDEHRKGSYL